VIWYEINDALTAHKYALSLNGGAMGIRDRGLLESALNRPQVLAHYEDEQDVIRLGVLYICGIILNHPFVDGNKRTGFLVGIAFMEINGFLFNAPQDETAVMIEAFAGKSINEATLELFIREHTVSA
jgi:death on curing protein